MKQYLDQLNTSAQQAAHAIVDAEIHWPVKVAQLVDLLRKQHLQQLLKGAQDLEALTAFEEAPEDNLVDKIMLGCTALIVVGGIMLTVSGGATSDHGPFKSRPAPTPAPMDPGQVITPVTPAPLQLPLINSQ